MIICSNCGYKNREGALFCDQCHVALTAISVGTKVLGSDNLPAGSDRLDDEHIIFLHVQGYEDPITVQVHDRVVLGRSGGGKGDTGHVNLDGYGAETLGVSRRHAGLFRDESRLYLSDLGSTNSTYLNGQRINQGEYMVVRDSDEIRLGHLNMRLFFK